MTCKSTHKKFMPVPQSNRGHKVTRILPRRWFALAVLLIAFGLPSLVVQEDLLAVFGTVKHEESNKKLQGVRVVVFQDGVEFDAISTDARGDTHLICHSAIVTCSALSWPSTATSALRWTPPASRWMSTVRATWIWT